MPTIDENISRFEQLLSSVQRDGIDKLMRYIKKSTDFYKAPASTRFHLACEGGLLQHSLIHLDTFKATTILWVDTGSVEAKFQQLFKKIDNNRNIEEAKRLNFELDELIKFYGLPETMDVHYRLARIRFKQFEDAERTWNYRIEDINTTLDESIERGDKISLRKMEVCYIKI